MAKKFCSLCLTVLLFILGGVTSQSWATVVPYVADLGSAKQFTVLVAGAEKASADSVLNVQGTADITGDVALGADVDLTASGKANVIEGNLFTTAPTDVPSGVLEGKQIQSPEMVNKAISDAIAFSQTIENFTATQTFKAIEKSTTIKGNGGVNVIDFVGDGVNLDHKDVLTLSGNASDIFYINFLDSAAFSVSGAAQIALAGGVNPNNIYWNIVDGQDASITGGTVYGTILNNVSSVDTDFVLKNASLYGRVIGGGGAVSIVNGSVIGASVVEQAPEVRSLAMVGVFGFLTLLSTLRRRLWARPTLSLA